MLHAKAWRDDEGSAAVEFLLVGLIVLVPLVYLVIALGQIQNGALAAEAAARHLARAIATSSDAGDAQRRADRLARAVATEYDIDPTSFAVRVTCSPSHDGCPSGGATVRVEVRADIALPLVPALFDLDQAARVPVEAIGVQKVSRAWAP